MVSWMPKPPSAPLDYLAREFSEAQSLRSGDPELYRLVEQGLRSVEGARWVEVADALRYATGGWAVFFQDTAKRDRRALCWLVAAARHEHWISGVNHAIWLRSMFRKIPDAARHLAEME